MYVLNIKINLCLIIFVCNRDGNVFDSRKRMKAATADGLEHKLNSRQRSAITYNQAILAIYSNQVMIVIEDVFC